MVQLQARNKLCHWTAVFLACVASVQGAPARDPEIPTSCPSYLKGKTHYVQSYQGVCYWFIPYAKQSWRNSHTVCYGGHILEIKTQQVLDFIADHMDNTYDFRSPVWLNMSQQSSLKFWSGDSIADRMISSFFTSNVKSGNQKKCFEFSTKLGRSVSKVSCRRYTVKNIICQFGEQQSPVAVTATTKVDTSTTERAMSTTVKANPITGTVGVTTFDAKLPKNCPSYLKDEAYYVQSHQGVCYWFIPNERRDWVSSQEVCHGGYVLEITTQDLLDFIVHHMDKTYNFQSPVWLNMSQKSFNKDPSYQYQCYQVSKHHGGSVSKVSCTGSYSTRNNIICQFGEPKAQYPGQVTVATEAVTLSTEATSATTKVVSPTTDAVMSTKITTERAGDTTTNLELPTNCPSYLEDQADHVQSHQGVCYWFVPYGKRNWKTSQTACHGGHILEVKTQHVLDFIVGHMEKTYDFQSPVWLNMSQQGFDVDPSSKNQCFQLVRDYCGIVSQVDCYSTTNNIICQFGEQEPVMDTTEALNPTTKAVRTSTEVVTPTTEAVSTAKTVGNPTTEVARPTIEVANPATEVARTIRKVANPTTKVVRTTREVANPTTKVARTAIEVANPTTEVARTTTREVANPTTEVAKTAVEVANPTTEVARTTREVANSTTEVAKTTIDVANPTTEVARTTREVANPTTEVTRTTTELATEVTNLTAEATKTTTEVVTPTTEAANPTTETVNPKTETVRATAEATGATSKTDANYATRGLFNFITNPTNELGTGTPTSEPITPAPIRKGGVRPKCSIFVCNKNCMMFGYKKDAATNCPICECDMD
ncbi:LOW QUALITY PROTEIN: DNA-directed RNA polymerase large [Elysia marginata]|uniref:DNA-directed RNA polymerase large n=1 Tax=Elysia marginata TaxID=1093978 RepID=A0AAV4ETB8_9GAST|nr:LOW QUALITY PROTEIN: DNA-directed RNA polymerase large [Elysia marginata]